MQELKDLKEEMEAAQLPLQEEATQLVLYRGNPKADIMIVGEAPGKNEDEQGKPFLGRAGHVLDEAIEEAGLQSNSYITNIVYYRPPENRTPHVKEMEAHGTYLLRQIELLQPKIIMPLGNTATKYIVSWMQDIKKSQVEPITEIRGIALDTEPKIFPTYHPAATLYDRSKRPLFFKDFKRVTHLLT